MIDKKTDFDKIKNNYIYHKNDANATSPQHKSQNSMSHESDKGNEETKKDNKKLNANSPQQFRRLESENSLVEEN